MIKIYNDFHFLLLILSINFKKNNHFKFFIMFILEVFDNFLIEEVYLQHFSKRNSNYLSIYY